MLVTFWADLYNTTGAQRDPSWTQFCDSLQQPAVFDGTALRDAHCGGFSCGTYRDFHRADDATTSLSAVVLDFDDGTPLDQVASYAAGLQAALYTTMRHSAANPRCRLIVPLSRDVTPAEYARLWAYWQKRCEFHVDRTGRNPSRFFFLPCHSPSSTAPYEHRVLEGNVADVDTLLSIAPTAVEAGGMIAPADVETDSLLSHAFKAAGMLLKRTRKPEGWAYHVLCPNHEQHTCGKPGDSSTVVFPPTAESRVGYFHCSHDSCDADTTLKDWRSVLRRLPAEAGESAKAAYPQRQAPPEVSTAVAIPGQICLSVPDAFVEEDGKLYTWIQAKPTFYDQVNDKNTSQPIRTLMGDALHPIAILALPDGTQVIRVRNAYSGRHFELPRSMLADQKALMKVLTGTGCDVVTRLGSYFVQWFEAYLRINQTTMPITEARMTTGWDEKRETFMLGLRCIGGHDEIYGLSVDPGGMERLKCVHASGDPKKWVEGATNLLTAAPSWSVPLAAAIADPIIVLTEHRRIGIIATGPGGQGKSAMLRFCASAVGYTGSSNDTTGAGIIGRMGKSNTYLGTIRQYSRFKHIAHFGDECEMKTNPKDQEDAMVAIVDGADSARSTEGGRGTMAMPPFPACSLLAGEVDDTEIIRRQGTARRYLPLRAPYVVRESFGLLKDNMPLVVDNYGWQLQGVVESLVGMTPEQRRALKGHRPPEADKLGDRPSEAVAATRWDQMMSILVAIDVACGLCPDLFPERALWMGFALATLVGPARRFELAVPEQATWERIDEALQTLIASNQGHIIGMCGMKTPDCAIGKLATPGIVAISTKEVKSFLQPYGWSIGTFLAELADNGVILRKASKGNRDDYETSTRIGNAVMRCLYVRIAKADAEDDETSGVLILG